ncbi:hypothetical protein ACH4OW_25750 [Streptomyces sp. NPDC017056]|uniref:hypothetical protein n=1 Tax=Streptomyces sp. NPDC017056 TaxID=3364973 RepID=UPI0037A696B9
MDGTEGALAKRILTTGHERYDHAFGKACLAGSTATLTNEERAALAMGADATGAFAVPFQLAPTVTLTGGGVADPMRQIARVVPITGKTWDGLTSAGITVTREAAGVASGQQIETAAATPFTVADRYSPVDALPPCHTPNAS